MMSPPVAVLGARRIRSHSCPPALRSPRARCDAAMWERGDRAEGCNEAGRTNAQQNDGREGPANEAHSSALRFFQADAPRGSRSIDITSAPA